MFLALYLANCFLELLVEIINSDASPGVARVIFVNCPCWIHWIYWKSSTWKYFNQRAIDLKWSQIVHFIFFFLSVPVKKYPLLSPSKASIYYLATLAFS